PVLNGGAAKVGSLSPLHPPADPQFYHPEIANAGDFPPASPPGPQTAGLSCSTTVTPKPLPSDRTPPMTPCPVCSFLLGFALSQSTSKLQPLLLLKPLLDPQPPPSAPAPAMLPLEAPCSLLPLTLPLPCCFWKLLQACPGSGFTGAQGCPGEIPAAPSQAWATSCESRDSSSCFPDNPLFPALGSGP
ncbi:hypothetical protein P7K49_009074, partial [Saguinus oedipus]